MKAMTYRDAIKESLLEEMRQDTSVYLLGEDLADPMGGSLKVTLGISTEMGTERVRNTPISESAILGCAIGSATQGLRPVAEVMYEDFLPICMDMIINQMAKMRYMSGGAVEVPLVLRTQGGAGRNAGGQHSQSLESLLMHIPGLVVAMPSNPADAKGLLKTAIRSNDPVIFIENCQLYNVKGEVPEDENFTIPFGKAAILREGSDVTLVSYWRMVNDCLKAADVLAEKGISAEVIDLRTILPMDMETVLKSVEKTHRLVCISEDVDVGSVCKEIGANVGRDAFYSLDAPIEFVNTIFSTIPFCPVLESCLIPSVADIVSAAMRTMSDFGG